jgi:hypothetical protein
MTIDDAVKAVFGAILTGLASAVAWLIAKVLGNREAILVQQEKLRTLEGVVGDLQRNQITKDSVREAIEQALDRRDRANNERREEWDRRTALEIKQTVAVELERIVPRIVREVMELRRARNGNGSDERARLDD